MHRVLIGLGSNLGDRQGTILGALQKLRRQARIERVSSYYETPPSGGVAGPAFLNVAAQLETELEAPAFEVGLARNAVTGNAGLIAHDGPAPSRDSIKKSGLANVRPTHDHDRGRLLRHESSS